MLIINIYSTYVTTLYYTGSLEVSDKFLQHKTVHITNNTDARF